MRPAADQLWWLLADTGWRDGVDPRALTVTNLYSRWTLCRIHILFCLFADSLENIYYTRIHVTFHAMGHLSSTAWLLIALILASLPASGEATYRYNRKSHNKKKAKHISNHAATSSAPALLQRSSTGGIRTAVGPELQQAAAPNGVRVRRPQGPPASAAL